MTDSSGKPDHISCSSVALLLEKRVSEEVLSSDEQQALAHHLDHCERCRGFVKLTTNLSLFTDALTEEELDSTVREVMTTVTGRRYPAGGRKIRWTALAVAASIAALALIGTSFLSPLFDDSPVTYAAFQCAPAEPAELVPGVFMTYCDDRKPGVTIENSGEVKIALRSGTVGLLIDPERRNKHRVTVLTHLAEVRVKGTVFAVHVDRDNARVEVFRGVVEVVPIERDAASYYIAAGHGGELRKNKTFKLSHPTTDVLRQKLVAEVTGKGSGKALEAGEAVTKLSSREPPAPSDWTRLDKPAGLVEEVNQAEPGTHRWTEGGPKRPLKSIDTFIQDAQSCLIDRDWKCAASQYQEVLRRYSGRPESIAVLISLAKIELRHLNAPQKALGHYKSYQQQAPNGPLAEEALFGIADAYRRLGAKYKERETLRLFVARFPESAMLAEARSRLRRLEGSDPL